MTGALGSYSSRDGGLVLVDGAGCHWCKICEGQLHPDYSKVHTDGCWRLPVSNALIKLAALQKLEATDPGLFNAKTLYISLKGSDYEDGVSIVDIRSVEVFTFRHPNKNKSKYETEW